MDPASGMISGTPTQAGEFTVTVTASDGSASGAASFVLSVEADVVEPGDQTAVPRTCAGIHRWRADSGRMNYDDGGQGTAYNDTPGLSGGTNGGRTGSDVEVTALGDVGWIDDGEWLEYTIEVPQAGLYDLDLLLATNGGAGRAATVDFFLPGATAPYASTGPVANPVTGGWTTFLHARRKLSILDAGTQIVRITFTGGSQDIRSFTLTAQVSRSIRTRHRSPTHRSGRRSADEGTSFSLDVTVPSTIPMAMP